MTMKKAIYIIMLLAMTSTVYAQYGGGFWGYTYDISLPMGETSDFTGKTSFRGFTLQGRGYLNPQFSLGGKVGWRVFFEKLEDTHEFSFETDDGRPINGSVDGTQWKSINVFPILATAHWYNGDPSINDFGWHAGLGVGTSAIKRRVEIGVLAIEETKWHYTIAPEIGMTYGISTSVKAFLSAAYHYSMKTSDTPSNTYLSFHIGLASVF